MPLVTHYNPDARSTADLDDKQIGRFRLDYDLWKDQYSLFQKTIVAEQEIFIHILSTSSRNARALIPNVDNPHDALKTLKSRLAPQIEHASLR